MSRALEEAQERQRHEYVARELGISADVLDEHDWELEENSGDAADNEGVVYGWRVLWKGTPPEGVTVQGAEGSQWSDIAVEADEEDPDELS